LSRRPGQGRCARHRRLAELRLDYQYRAARAPGQPGSESRQSQRAQLPHAARHAGPASPQREPQSLRHSAGGGAHPSRRYGRSPTFWGQAKVAGRQLRGRNADAAA
nr:hypothetical protein [Tanacetum cinerariifolium]